MKNSTALTGSIFTPYENPDSDHRLKLSLSPSDAVKIGSGKGWGPVEVTDLTTGTVFKVQPADCGADCFCAAEVIEVVKQSPEKPEYWD